MSDIPSRSEKPRSRTRRFITYGMSMLLVTGLLSAMPASAIAYNERPEIQKEASVAGREAAEAAIAEDDTVEKASVTKLEEADWPEPETVELGTDGSEPEMRSFSVPGEDDKATATLGAIPQEDLDDWESPLPEDHAAESGTSSRDARADQRRDAKKAPPEPETTPSAPSPSAAPESSPVPSPGSEPSEQPEEVPEPTETPEKGESEPQERPEADKPTLPEVVQSAELEVLDRTQAEAVGVDGLLLRLTRTDGGTSTGPVKVGINYADFASAFGADYGSRLQLVALDDCVLQESSADCTGGVDLDSVNDPEAQTLTAVAPASSSGTLLAATAGAESDKGTGDYTATPLSASSEWNVGVQTGDFSWSYPMTTPNVAGGLTPDLALNYSSQSVDGRTASSNNQTSWIGEGFQYQPGYIERRYKLCQDDDKEVADQCWSRHNATLSLNGQSTELIIDEDGEWHPRNDDGAKVERLTGADNGDNDGEYWKVTTTDGTRYYFGKNRLPGWSSGDPETKSAWTTPVYGNDSGEPCHDSTFADSWCQQAYKWNLDYVVDVHGNVITYYYEDETNHYGRNMETEATPYDRGGYLKRIEYGLRSDDVFGTAPARVKFGVGERCLPTDDFDCAADERTEDNADHWPDVPTDQECASDEKCTGKHSASFWSTKKLNKVTTQVHNGSEYSTVDSWELEHKFPEPGDGTDPALWLNSVTHTGHVGGTASYPKITFGGTSMENRVDGLSDGLAPMRKWRITAIYTETGGQVDVSYSAPECKRDSAPEPDDNTKRCYPVIWTPEGEEELTDWFHKYVVTQVSEIDLVARQPAVITSYDYVGGAAWHFDDADGIVPEDRKTWSQFRGYEKVKVNKGHPNGTRSETEHLFYRGMDGDKLESGTRSATVTDSEGTTVDDHDAFNGMTREVITRNGPGGEVVSKAITTPWKKQTAEREYSWGTLRGYLTNTKTTEDYTALSEGWRTTKTVNTFDEHGFITTSDDQGDTSTPEDDRCVRTSYARNTDKWLLDKVSRVETVAAACGDTPSRPADVISDERTFYDGKGFGEAPTRGLVTKTQRIADYEGETAEYQTTAETTHDSYGRALTSTDALGNTTTTEYSAKAAGGAPATVTTTNALGHTSTKHMDARSSVTAEIDANGNRTDLTYDPFGRLTAVWLADRPKEDHSPNLKFEYNVRKDAPTSVVTRKLNHNAEYVTSYEIYDGLLRPRQTQAPTVDGDRVITDVFRDSRGLKVKEREPYRNGEAPSDSLFIVNNDDEIPRQTETVHDGAGRVTDEIHVSRGEEQWRTSTEYLGDRTRITAPEGGIGTTTITDARAAPPNCAATTGAHPRASTTRPPTPTQRTTNWPRSPIPAAAPGSTPTTCVVAR